MSDINKKENKFILFALLGLHTIEFFFFFMIHETHNIRVKGNNTMEEKSKLYLRITCFFIENAFLNLA